MHKPLHDHLHLALLPIQIMFSSHLHSHVLNISNLLSLQMWRYSILTCCFLVCVWIPVCVCVCVNVLMFALACVCVYM